MLVELFTVFAYENSAVVDASEKDNIDYYVDPDDGINFDMFNVTDTESDDWEVSSYKKKKGEFERFSFQLLTSENRIFA